MEQKDRLSILEHKKILSDEFSVPENQGFLGIQKSLDILKDFLILFNIHSSFSVKISQLRRIINPPRIEIT